VEAGRVSAKGTLPLPVACVDDDMFAPREDVQRGLMRQTEQVISNQCSDKKLYGER